jgi:hypothetical protein
MRLFLWGTCAAIALAAAGCEDVTADHAIEVRCVTNTGFNDDKLCAKPDRLGAEIEVKVNVSAQKAQIAIVKNDGNWGIKDFILDDCAMVDSRNWKCTETNGSPGGPIYVVREWGMLHGRLYMSLTGGGPPNYYRSSISGLTFLALRYGMMDTRAALRIDGYSTEALRSLGTDKD